MPTIIILSLALSSVLSSATSAFFIVKYFKTKTKADYWHNSWKDCHDEKTELWRWHREYREGLKRKGVDPDCTFDLFTRYARY